VPAFSEDLDKEKNDVGILKEVSEHEVNHVHRVETVFVRSKLPPFLHQLILPDQKVARPEKANLHHEVAKHYRENTDVAPSLVIKRVTQSVHPSIEKRIEHIVILNNQIPVLLAEAQGL
jgi:hypothetical protein